MKKFLLAILALYCISVKAQLKEPSTAITVDFCRNIFIQVKVYNNDNIKAYCYLAGRNLGYGLVDIEEAIENINKNKKFRDELQKSIVRNYGNQEMLALNLISIGMRATNAKLLAKYLIIKYSSTNNSDVSKRVITSNFNLPEKIKEEPSEFEILTSAEYIGGQKVLNKFIQDNLTYPEAAKKNEVEGTLSISFQIDRDGSIQNVHVMDENRFGFGLEEEAIRVISKMPNWKPAIGTISKKHYVSNMNLSIKFELSEADLKDTSWTKSEKLEATKVVAIFNPNHEMVKASLHLPEPRQLLKTTYKAIIDSLSKKKIEFKCDSAFGEDEFYGYNLHTSDGDFFLNVKHIVESYEFQAFLPLDDVKKYFIKRGAMVKKTRSDYYMLIYKGYLIEINFMGEGQTGIDYETQ
jgi:TonB family protein